MAQAFVGSTLFQVFMHEAVRTCVISTSADVANKYLEKDKKESLA